MVPALAGYIAYSIADRPGIAPGMTGGVIAGAIGAGFLGGIVAGFIAGYAVLMLTRVIRLPRTLQGLMPVLILPLLGTAITGLLMYYVVGAPTAKVLAALTAWLQGMQGSSAAILGLILGGMMAVDMGGPINKAAYVFGTTLIASNVTEPMAAVMCAGMTPPLALAIASKLFPSRFTAEEREAGNAAFVLGLAFVTEGPFPLPPATRCASSLVDRRIGHRRCDLHGVGRAVESAAWWDLRAADPQCGGEPAWFCHCLGGGDPGFCRGSGAGQAPGGVRGSGGATGLKQDDPLV